MSVVGKLKRIEDKFGKLGILAMLVYPIFIIPVMAYTLFRSLMSIVGALVGKKWFYLTGNTVHVALNNYFYRVQDVNLQRFGRYNDSQLVAGGDGFSLRNWFHTTPASLRIFSFLGPVATLLLALIVWTGSWFYFAEPSFLNIAVLVIAMCSTYYFVNFIDSQNYNVLGWMLLPLVLHFLFDQEYVLFCLLVFLGSFFSFTFTVVVSVIAFIMALYWLDPFIVVAFMPAAVKIAIPIFVSVFSGFIKKMGGAVGVHDEVKYKRSDKKINTVFIYIGILSVIFIAAYFLHYGLDELLILQLVVFALFCINSTISRFADPQTLFILFLTVFCFSMMDKSAGLLMFLAYLLAVNPYYYVFGYAPLLTPVFPLARKPFDTKELLARIADLTRQLNINSRTLFLFSNPQNQYGKAFEGYRGAIEPILYQFNKENQVIFPDWFYMYEFNKLSDTDLIWWNEDEALLKEGISLFRADYILAPEEIFKSNVPSFLEQLHMLSIDEIGKTLILYKVID